MPRNRQPDEAARTKFLASMSPKERGTFQKLEALLGNRRDDLAWHHEFGTLVERLRRGRGDRTYGTEWYATLGKAIGFSKSPLHKLARFARDYKESELESLENRGITYSKLVLAHRLKDKDERHSLVEEAVRQGLSDTDLHRLLLRRFGVKRHGGRKLKSVKVHGWREGLREIARLGQHWNHVHQANGNQVKDELLRLFAGKKPEEFDSELLELLPRAYRQLREVAKRASDLSRSLKELAKTAQEERGRREKQ